MFLQGGTCSTIPSAPSFTSNLYGFPEGTKHRGLTNVNKRKSECMDFQFTFNKCIQKLGKPRRNQSIVYRGEGENFEKVAP